MAKVSAFGAATKKAPAQAKGPSGPIFVANELKAPDGEVIYSKEQIIVAVEEYCEGKDEMDRGESLMSKNEKPITDFARALYAQVWAKSGRRPEHSPKVLTDEKGDGAMVTVEFKDAEKNLTDAQFLELSALIGDDNAKSVTTRRFDYSLNSAMLAAPLTELPEIQVTDEEGNLVFFNEKSPDKTVAVDEDSKPPKGYKPKMRQQTYYDVVEAALSEKFLSLFGEEKAGEKIGGLMIRKPVFKTNKGMIDRLLEFVGTEDTVEKLDKAIVAGNVTTAIKAGSLAKKPAEAVA